MTPELLAELQRIHKSLTPGNQPTLITSKIGEGEPPPGVTKERWQKNGDNLHRLERLTGIAPLTVEGWEMAAVVFMEQIYNLLPAIIAALSPAPASDFDREQGPRYAAELDKIAELLQGIHPLGAVKGFGRLECVTALEQLLSDLRNGVDLVKQRQEAEATVSEEIEKAFPSGDALAIPQPPAAEEGR